MKNKYWLIAGVVVGIVALSGVAAYAWHSTQNQKVSLGAASENISAASQQNSTTDGSAGTLSATTQAQNLGQIGGSQKSISNSSSFQGQSSSSSSSGSSSSSNPVDPSTFGQYDKYKSSTQALFADLSKGDGATAGNGQTATVLYKGWLTNGQLFDQSHQDSSGKYIPFQFTIGGGKVIAGWDQGITGMKVGGTRLLVVPPSVGYGAAGQGPIPGNSVLVFQVQLVNVQ